MNLIDLALTTYTEGTAAQAEQDAEYAVEAREELLRFARACAASTLCADAASLDWRCTTEGAPEQVEEARAFLVPGHSEYLRYRIDHNDVDNVSFDLVRPCLACGHDRITKVNSLFDLGRLLHQGDRHPNAEEDQAPEEEPGPLAAVQGLAARSAELTTLAGRLHSEHPTAGVTIARTSLFGHLDGTTSATLHLSAADVTAARAVATALGIDLTTKTVDHTGPYPAVMEHAQASTTIDGVQVELAAFTELTDDEATAWRAQQNQATEDEAAVPAGGEGE